METIKLNVNNVTKVLLSSHGDRVIIAQILSKSNNCHKPHHDASSFMKHGLLKEIIYFKTKYQKSHITALLTVGATSNKILPKSCQTFMLSNIFLLISSERLKNHGR